MSNLVMGRIFKSSGTQSNDRLMMLCIGDNADDHGHAWPGTKLLADKMGNKSRSTAAVRIDALSQTNELGVYPKAGDSHHYLVFTGMTFNEARIAIRRLAKKFKVSTSELAKMRREYQAEARQRIEARKSKKLQRGDTPSVQPGLYTPAIQVGDTPAIQGVTDIVIHEPSLTLIQPPQVAHRATQRKLSVERRVDVEGKAINNQHPQWSSFWEAVMKVKGYSAAGLTKSEAKLIASVVQELIEPLTFEAADVLYFGEWVKEQEWSKPWTVKAIPNHITTVRAARLQQNEPRRAGPRVIKLTLDDLEDVA